METITIQLEQLLALICWPYLLVFVLLSSVAKKAIGAWIQANTKKRWKPVHTVLIIATIIAVPFIWFGYATWLQVIVSYALGTSFYEIILDKIEAKIKGK